MRSRSPRERYGRRKKASARPDLLPLLDVIFSVLACFAFVVALSEVRPGALSIELPSADSAPSAQSAQRPPLVVSYDAEGRVEVDGQAVELDALEAHLASLLEREPDRALRLRGDEDARLAVTAQVLAAASGAGGERVQIAVREPASRL